MYLCCSGRITYYTHPPEEKKTVHVDAKIVEQMAKEFDWVRFISFVFFFKLQISLVTTQRILKL